MSRVGILGGTFDPIHLGHLITAENAFDAAGLDEVILIPTGCSYFKEDQKVTPALQRYEMTCLAAEGNSHLRVTDLETKRPGNSYTAVTLQELQQLRPQDEFFYIVGADTLVMMSMWKDPQAIFDACTLLVETRQDEVTDAGLEDEARKLRVSYGARIVFLPARSIEISSTEIRARVREGKSVRYLVPDRVEKYIREHELYT